MRHWFPDFPREPKDIDYISKDDIMSREEEHHWISEFQYFLDNNEDDTYLDAKHLITLKESHAGWNINWEKTMHDITFLQRKGLKADRTVYSKLVKGWIKIHGVRWVSMKNKDSTTFFEDAVDRKYVHDDIHEAISVYDKPLFESLVVEGVTCSEDGFNKLSYEDKILLVKEEVWVTALERWLIPEDFKMHHQVAYSRALKKLATTMSSGYFKFFILDNWNDLRYDSSKEYIEKFKQAEKNNKIRKYEKH